MDKWAILIWNGEELATKYVNGVWGPVPPMHEIVLN